MRDIAEKLKLKGLAEEDIFFARRDRELIEALRRKKLEEHAKCTNKKGVDKAAAYQEEFDEITRKHSKKPKRLLKSYRKLIDKIRKKCHRN